jgi:hypothetical protein
MSSQIALSQTSMIGQSSAPLVLDSSAEDQAAQLLTNWGGSHQVTVQSREDTVGRSDALLMAIALITNLGLIVFGSLAIAEKIDSSFAGWTIVALTLVQLIFLVSKFIVSSKEKRTGSAFVGYICCPTLMSVAPLTCGVLAAQGTISGYTAGAVTVGTMAGLATITCCFVCVTLFSGVRGSNSPSYDRNQQSTQQAIRADQLV